MNLLRYLLLGVIAQSFVSSGVCSDPYEQGHKPKVRSSRNARPPLPPITRKKTPKIVEQPNVVVEEEVSDARVAEILTHGFSLSQAAKQEYMERLSTPEVEAVLKFTQNLYKQKCIQKVQDFSTRDPSSMSTEELVAGMQAMQFLVANK
ncbi:MAG: hypothetical protein WCJ92_02715 [Alphaproteobacteria bacterium]